MSSSGLGDASAPRAQRPDVRLLAVLSLLMGFASISTDLYLPAMPAIATSLGTDHGMIETSVSRDQAAVTQESSDRVAALQKGKESQPPSRSLQRPCSGVQEGEERGAPRSRRPSARHAGLR
jgi:hypothetical protein